MEFHKKLYCEPYLRRRMPLIKWNLKHNKVQPELYVILLSNNDDQLEFFHTSYLQQLYYQKKSLYVVGIAGSRMGAMNVIESLVKEVYEQTGDVNLKEYLRIKKR